MTYDNHSAARLLSIALGAFVAVSVAWLALSLGTDASPLAAGPVVIGLSLIALTLALTFLNLKLSSITVADDGLAVRAWPRRTVLYPWAEIEELRKRGRGYVVFAAGGTFEIRPLERARTHLSGDPTTAAIDELIAAIRTRAPHARVTASRLHVGPDQNGSGGKAG